MCVCVCVSVRVVWVWWVLRDGGVAGMGWGAEIGVVVGGSLSRSCYLLSATLQTDGRQSAAVSM